MSRVVLAMSGGVDSSVAAWLLREQGHDVLGLFMRHGQQDQCAGDSPGGRDQGCCSAADAADARRVAQMLGIPFYVVNFEQEFERIVDYFVREYTAGRTPNPCIVCNTWIKFGKLLEYADSVNAQFVATGHYARLEAVGKGDIALCRGRDDTKDQSYVLFGIRRELLHRLKFPLGEYRKDEIRQIAERLRLRVAEKRDSQEICFVPRGNHAAFVKTRRDNIDTSGEIVDTRGTVLGYHDGLERFTIGQRKGLRIALGEPRYVVRIEADTRRIVVGSEKDLDRQDLVASRVNWLSDAPGESFRCRVKIRYASPAAEATVRVLPEDRLDMSFDAAVRGVAPGQAAVCYDGDRVLGGGWIE